MDYRKLSIIKKLLHNSNLNYEQLSLIFKCSERTIRKDIENINIYFEKLLLPKIIFENKKLILSISEKEFLYILKTLSIYEYAMNTKEKQIMISLLFLYHKELITTDYIADFLYLSKSSVSIAIREMEKIFRSYNLCLEAKAGKGYKLLGEIENKRLLLQDIVIESFHLMNIFINKIYSINNDYKDLSIVIKDVINKVETLNNNYLSDKSFYMLYSYILFICKKNVSNSHFYIDSNNIKNNYNKFSLNLVESLKEYINIYEEESTFNKFLSCLEFDIKLGNNRYFIQLQVLTQKIIKIISNELEVNFFKDYDLFEKLSNHLESLYNIKGKYIKDNLPLDDLKIKYEFLYSSINNNIGIIEKFINRKLYIEEIDYIFLYFCLSIEKYKIKSCNMKVLLISDFTYAYTEMIRLKLSNYFGLNICRIIKSRDLNHNIIDEYDFVISTTIMQCNYSKLLVISQHFNELDCVNIYRFLNRFYYKNSNYYREQLNNDINNKKVYKKNPQLHLGKYLTKENILINVSVSNWEDAVYIGGSILKNNGAIEDSYIEAMIENLKNNGFYVLLANNLIVPHASINRGSIKTAFSLVRLKKPLFIKEINQDISFICCMSCVDKTSHIDAFYNLIQLFNNDVFRKAIDNAESVEEAAIIIKKFELLMEQGDSRNE